jgi:hypothetical protein
MIKGVMSYERIKKNDNFSIDSGNLCVKKLIISTVCSIKITIKLRAR